MDDIQLSDDNSMVGKSTSLQLFVEACALNDLVELDHESNSCPIETSKMPAGMPFKLKSDLYPVGSRGKDMDLLQKLVEGDLTHLACKCSVNCMQDNLTICERTALTILREDDKIVIRNADKEGLVVILDSGAYRMEAIRQLSDTDTNLHLKANPAQSFKKALSLLIDRGVTAGVFTGKETDIFASHLTYFPFSPEGT